MYLVSKIYVRNVCHIAGAYMFAYKKCFRLIYIYIYITHDIYVAICATSAHCAFTYMLASCIYVNMLADYCYGSFSIYKIKSSNIMDSGMTHKRYYTSLRNT